jgi:3-methyladenine DNA glycosylase AlkC
MTEPKRKGSASIKDIPTAILQQLNSGHIESANLVEWLAVDQRVLLAAILEQANRTAYLDPVLARIASLHKQTVNTLNAAIGSGLLEQALKHDDHAFLASLAAHPSDSVRCWAAYAEGRNPHATIAQKLSGIRPFAVDPHFGVREIAWMAVRPAIAQHLAASLDILSGWSADPDANARRFASEATRPRGVWCEHIDELKTDPVRGLPILEPLKSDPSKYVRDSVGNWLNDASKTRPDFVSGLCRRWEVDSPTPETHYIIKKALRTIGE